MIPITKPFLPSLEEYTEYLNGIWARNWLTNNGPLVNELELKLKRKLGVKHLLFLSNGTMALQFAINALELKGEILTTPFSYVATTSSIVWENCMPVFVDIDKETLNIDSKLIENSITDHTSAILATHCFGNPCDIEVIHSIAEKHGLKIIYDAAHCFGVKYNGRSILEYGDISAISFHATKIFHTVEGGAVVSNNPDLIKKIVIMRSFGHSGPYTFDGIGINGKNSELHAAMGLVNLLHIDEGIKEREAQIHYYDQMLNQSEIRRPAFKKKCEHNYSYYPIIFESEELLILVLKELEKREIFPRRYFYPLLSELDYVKNKDLPEAKSISRRIMCLPLYHGLSKEEINMISRIIIRTIKYS